MKKKQRSPIHAYKRLLANDHDWDYAYLIALEKKKLQRMRECIKEEFRKLEDGNYELVDDDRKPLADLPVYVNVRNERRYFRSTPIKDALSENRRDWPIHLKISLRKQKALHLYHLIREYKLFDWWD